MTPAKTVWKNAWEAGIPQRALLVALVVGTALNLINQGDALFARHSFNWGKALLTYAVPFCVSVHGALSTRKAF